MTTEIRCCYNKKDLPGLGRSFDLSHTYFFFLTCFYPEIVADIINSAGGKGDAQHQKEHIHKPAAGGINVLKDRKRALHIRGDVEAVYLIPINEIEALGHSAGNIVDDDAFYVGAAVVTDTLTQIEIKTDENEDHMPDIGMGSQGDNGVLDTAWL